MDDPTAGDESGRSHLEQAIAIQEGLRGALGDAVVDTTIAALRAQLERLEASAAAGPRRRMVTVVFVDVADSTELFRDRDPEETMAIMDSALERLARPIHTAGGRVTRFMGDGYLAVFGLPVSRENDPEMAVRAGLAVQSEAAGIAAELSGRGIGRFAVRVGINTGLVVSGGSTEAEDTIMGAQVNIAARLEAAAPAGGVLISHGTFQHVRDRCSVEPYGEVAAKGLDPIPAYRVVSMVEEQRRGARPVVDGIVTPMIGREAELAALTDALAGARRSGTLRIVAVSGQPGTGKSRLVREFEDGLGEEVRAVRARVGPDDRNVPYALVRDLLTRCLGIAIGDTIPEVRRKLVAGLAATLGPDGEERAVALGRLAGFSVGDPAEDPERLRDRALASLAEFLDGRPERAATVLVAEDLQWADRASLDALARIADQLAGAPILLIASARPEFWEAGTGPGLDRHRVELGPLDEQHAARLVDAVLDAVEGETFLLRRLLLAGAEGNPYFLEEIVRMLVDDGVLVRTESGWAVAPSGLTGMRVPPTLSGVLQARLDALGEAERSVLQRASVVGRVFWDGAVEELTGGPVGGLLDGLVVRDMVVVHDTSSFGGTREYAFRHNVLREVVYESVLLDDRRSLHARVADWLLEQNRSDELTGLLATHLERAGRTTEALGYLARAAEQARSGYAVDSAADFYDRALALVPPGDPRGRFDLLFGRQEIAGLQGNRSGQRAALAELEELADGLDDAGKQALVAVERTWLEHYAGDFPAALAAAERAARLSEEAGDDALQSRARSARAWAHLALDDLDRAEQDGQSAVALAERAGHLEYEASARNTLGMVALAGGDPSRSSSHLRQALELARRRGDVGAETTYLNNLAVARMMIGDFAGARGYFGRTLELAEAAGDATGLSSAYTNLAWAAAGLGEWETGCDMARRALSMKRRQGHREAEAEALLWLGHALTGLGRIEDALDAYRSSLAIRQDLNQAALALGVRAGMARAELAGNDTAAALSHVEAILAHLDAGGSLDGTWEPLKIHLTCIEVLEAAADGRRQRVLERAAAELAGRAARVTDAGDRRMLLEDVPWHRRITELAGIAG